MQIRRMFSTANVKGCERYLDTQKKYEIIRTILYFAIPLSLFAAGIIQTQASVTQEKMSIFSLFLKGLANPKSRVNLLSIVAVVGLLPASKSLVAAIMFLRFHSLDGEIAESLREASGDLKVIYDCVFTSYKKNYVVGHLAVRGNVICGYSQDKSFDEKGFYRHIGEILKLDGHSQTTVKVFTDPDKYRERLKAMGELADDEAVTRAVTETLKSVML